MSWLDLITGTPAPAEQPPAPVQRPDPDEPPDPEQAARQAHAACVGQFANARQVVAHRGRAFAASLPVMTLEQQRALSEELAARRAELARISAG
jgi:hypothetical protein